MRAKLFISAVSLSAILATAACLLQTGLQLTGSTAMPLTWLRGAMLAGIGLTLGRRLRGLSRTLHTRQP